MSTIARTWTKTAPPAPGVYLTRRNASKYTTIRHWSGTEWWEIACCTGPRGGRPFKWPKGSGIKRPYWVKEMEERGQSLGLRAIRLHQDAIEWGKPYPVFSDAEMLKFLVQAGCLRADWRESTQLAMREARGAA